MVREIILGPWAEVDKKSSNDTSEKFFFPSFSFVRFWKKPKSDKILKSPITLELV